MAQRSKPRRIAPSEYAQQEGHWLEPGGRHRAGGAHDFDPANPGGNPYGGRPDAYSPERFEPHSGDPASPSTFPGKHRKDRFSPETLFDQSHMANLDPLQAYNSWCKANNLKKISARNVAYFAGNDTELCMHLVQRMRRAIHQARLRQAGEHDLSEGMEFFNNPEYTEQRHALPELHPYFGPGTDRGGKGRMNKVPGLPGEGRHRAEARQRQAGRRYAQPDYLQKADDALTQLLNQKAEEFQQTIAPLQQALVTVQQAEQLQQAQNPLNVLPPPGTVNVMPGSEDAGPAGMPAAGAQDLGGAAQALAGGGAPPPDQGAPGGGMPEGPAGGPPPAAGAGGLPPELEQQMTAGRRARRPKGEGATRPRQAGVGELWDKWKTRRGEEGDALRGDEVDYPRFQQQTGVGERAMQKLKQRNQRPDWGPVNSPALRGGRRRNAWAPGRVPKASPAPKPLVPAKPKAPKPVAQPDASESWPTWGSNKKEYLKRPGVASRQARQRYLSWCHRHRVAARSTKTFFWYAAQVSPAEYRLLTSGSDWRDPLDENWDEIEHNNPDRYPSEKAYKNRREYKPEDKWPRSGQRKQAWSGWGPAVFPETRQVTGWDWDNHLNGYLSNRPQHFACECGTPFSTPSGFHRCGCGKQWNSYVIGTGGSNHEAAADKYLVREIPVRPDVIVANRRLANYEDMPDDSPQPIVGRPADSDYHLDRGNNDAAWALHKEKQHGKPLSQFTDDDWAIAGAPPRNGGSGTPSKTPSILGSSAQGACRRPAARGLTTGNVTTNAGSGANRGNITRPATRARPAARRTEGTIRPLVSEEGRTSR